MWYYVITHKTTLSTRTPKLSKDNIMIKRLKLTILSLLVSVGIFASETSVTNEQGIEIWYIFDTTTKTASVTTYSGYDYDSNYCHESYSNEYSGNIVIPATVVYNGEVYKVTTIGKHAFSYCKGLTSVTIPEGVTSIEKFAFAGCEDLTSVTIPKGVMSIGNHAFRDCNTLTNITIPQSVTYIGENAFKECHSLTSITIPKSVTSIEIGAFRNCTNLTSITSLNTTPPDNIYNALDYNGKSISIYVPKQSLEAYISADNREEFTNILPLE